MALSTLHKATKFFQCEFISSFDNIHSRLLQLERDRSFAIKVHCHINLLLLNWNDSNLLRL